MHFFSNARASHWSKTCVSSMSKMKLLVHAMPFAQHLLWRIQGIFVSSFKHLKYVLKDRTSFFWIHGLIFFQHHAQHFENVTLWCRQVSSWKVFEGCASLNRTVRQGHLTLTYSILHACSTLLKEYSRPWRIRCSICAMLFNLCNAPLIWVRCLIKRIHYCWIVLNTRF